MQGDTEAVSGFDRRKFVQGALALASTALAGVAPSLSFATPEAKKQTGKAPDAPGVEETTPVEDLMREHGALNRVLLIYEEALRRLRVKADLDPLILQKSARIVRDFIEDYHEKLEEEHVFPRLKKAGRLLDTVRTLEAQHRGGRILTDAVIAVPSSPERFRNDKDRGAIMDALAKFIRMYRPHEAREDTVVFPELKKIVTPTEYHRLGELFEDREHELFGKAGFEGVIDKIADLEKKLGINDLAKFTPDGAAGALSKRG